MVIIELEYTVFIVLVSPIFSEIFLRRIFKYNMTIYKKRRTQFIEFFCVIGFFKAYYVAISTFRVVFLGP